VVPTPLPVRTGVIGFALALPRVERPTCHLRLVAEMFGIYFLKCLGFGVAWAQLWWAEQRW
jgi:hypothetical protein